MVLMKWACPMIRLASAGLTISIALSSIGLRSPLFVIGSTTVCPMIGEPRRILRGDVARHRLKTRRSHPATQPRSRTAPARGTDARGNAALPGFFYRLAPRDQKVYLRSDAIDTFDLVVGPNALALAEVLIAALASGSVTGTGRAAQALVAELC